jgi:hypothetical protein
MMLEMGFHRVNRGPWRKKNATTQKREAHERSVAAGCLVPTSKDASKKPDAEVPSMEAPPRPLPVAVGCIVPTQHPPFTNEPPAKLPVLQTMSLHNNSRAKRVPSGPFPPSGRRGQGEELLPHSPQGSQEALSSQRDVWHGRPRPWSPPAFRRKRVRRRATSGSLAKSQKKRPSEEDRLPIFTREDGFITRTHHPLGHGLAKTHDLPGVHVR